MSMFEKASRQKLRFSTSKGVLLVEDLWDLSLQNLNVIAKDLKKSLKESQEEDFLEEKSSEDTIIKLKFDIVLYILDTKKSEQKLKQDESLKKIEKEKLLEIIAKKKNESLENLSIEDLEAKLKSL